MPNATDPLNPGEFSFFHPSDLDLVIAFWFFGGALGIIGPLRCLYVVWKHARTWTIPTIQRLYVAILCSISGVFFSSYLTLLFPRTHATFTAVRCCLLTTIVSCLFNVYLASFAPQCTPQTRITRLGEVLHQLVVVPTSRSSRTSTTTVTVPPLRRISAHNYEKELEVALSVFKKPTQGPIDSFVFVVPVVGIIGKLLSDYNIWGYVTTRQHAAWFALACIVFLATAVAMYVMWRFVYTLRDACQHPYTQFLPVFTFAVAITSQDVAIGIVGILHPFTLGVTYTTEYDATMLMNFLLCIESALWGLWFSAVFGVGEFKGVYPSPHGWLRTEVVLFLQPGQFGRDDLHDPIPPQAWATGGGPSRSIADLPVENPLVEDLDGDDHVDPHDVHVVDVGAAHHDDQAEWSNPAEPPTAAIRGPRQPGVGFSLRERSNLERLEGELPPDSLSGGAPIISNE